MPSRSPPADAKALSPKASKPTPKKTEQAKGKVNNKAGSDKKKNKKKQKPSIDGFFARSKVKYTRLASFHTLHVSANRSRVLLELRWNSMDRLFFPQLTLRGVEGSMPEMWDLTPKMTGLSFRKSPSSEEIILCEPQQHQAATDLGSSIFAKETRGYQPGYIRVFKPLVVDAKRRATLVDITAWLASFSAYVNRAVEGMMRMRGGMGASETRLVDIRAFPQNFFVRATTQRRAGAPLKPRVGGTKHFVVAFCLLPQHPMTPRPYDRRVGYFTTRVQMGGPKSPPFGQFVINRWDLRRRNNEIVYVIDPSVPRMFHKTIKDGVTSWNAAFRAAGFKNNPVKCYSEGDQGFPEDYECGDARWSAIYMTDPNTPVYGFGPSVTDFRSGEILVSHVLLGFGAFVQGASMHSLEAANKDPRRPRLDADHPDVVRNLHFTVMHEVGHTLGLRHNFISTEDGNSSVMDYPDDMDTASTPGRGVYGGNLPNAPGEYDVYAIKYGYTYFADESWWARHRSLDVLANGQEANEKLSPEPKNPLFATDENVYAFDPRVNRWSNRAALMGRDKLVFAAKRRQDLLRLVEKGTIYPEEYTRRINRLFSQVLGAVSIGARFISGSYLDASRTNITPVPKTLGLSALRSIVDFCVGPLLRVSASERKYMMVNGRGSYALQQVDAGRLHQKYCDMVIEELVRELPALESQAAVAPDAGAPQPLCTYDVLMCLAFKGGNAAQPIFTPVAPQPSSVKVSPDDINKAACDVHRATARVLIARAARQLIRHENIRVRLGAQAFVSVLKRVVKKVLSTQGIDQMARAQWTLVRAELKKKKTNSSSTPHVQWARPRDGIRGGGMLCGTVHGEPRTHAIPHEGCGHLSCSQRRRWKGRGMREVEIPVLGYAPEPRNIRSAL